MAMLAAVQSVEFGDGIDAEHDGFTIDHETLLAVL